MYNNNRGDYMIIRLFVFNFFGYNNFSDFISSTDGINIIKTLVAIIIAAVIIRIIRVYIKKLINKNGSNKRIVTISKLIRNSISLIIWFVTALFILPIWGINISAILASLGIVGFALGFGAQKFVQDLINGLFIIIEKHYEVGDVVEINGFKGEVVLMGIRTTRIKNWKGELKIINNGDITSSINYSKNPSVGIVDFGVSYNSDLSKVREVLINYLDKFEENFIDIVEKPEFLGVTELAESSINLRIIFKSNPNKHFAIERKMREDIKVIFDKNNIEIPFPQVVVHNG